MNKGTQKSKRKFIHDPIRVSAIKWTATKHSITEMYVRQVVRGDFTGGMSEEILASYRSKYAELKQVLS